MLPLIAAVLYTCSHCLDDLDLAQSSGYPAHLSYKLHQRRANALYEMYRFKEAESEYALAIAALDLSR